MATKLGWIAVVGTLLSAAVATPAFAHERDRDETPAPAYFAHRDEGRLGDYGRYREGERIERRDRDFRRERVEREWMRRMHRRPQRDRF